YGWHDIFRKSRCYNIGKIRLGKSFRL
ncbi:uncharacterized protein METZ01_LOCUS509397, partial [marine metagenome]